jgi:hypothetical protein
MYLLTSMQTYHLHNEKLAQLEMPNTEHDDIEEMPEFVPQ